MSTQRKRACGKSRASARKPGRYSTQVWHHSAQRQLTTNSEAPSVVGDSHEVQVFEDTRADGPVLACPAMKTEVMEKLHGARDFHALTGALLSLCEPFGPV